MMNTDKLPLVLRSWEELYARQPGLKRPAGLPLDSLGATYAMAQELTWLDDEHFVVGRWDGSMSIFQFTQSAEKGPLMSKVVNTPACEGVQMITRLVDGVFATSNDDYSVIVWRCNNSDWENMLADQVLVYEKKFGVANSGVSFIQNGAAELYLIIGHSNGFVTTWQGSTDGSQLCLIAATDVRAARPVNPFGMYNVRGIVYLPGTVDAPSLLVTASEDGDLCILSIPEGKILARQVYNPNAQRGINSIALFQNKLLVANCAVGPDDHNLWLFDIGSGTQPTLHCRDAVNLQSDISLAQVFNFDVMWGQDSSGPCWFSATEEGLLWMGSVSPEGKLNIIGNQQVTAKLGAAIAITQQRNIAIAAYDIYEFNLR